MPSKIDHDTTATSTAASSKVGRGGTGGTGGTDTPESPESLESPDDLESPENRESLESLVFGGGEGEDETSEEAEAAAPEMSTALSEADSPTEVYHTDDEIVAGFVIDEVFRPAGIPARRHERRSRSIPAPAALTGEIGIAVPASLAAQARQLLREARQEGVLIDDGEIIDEDGEEASD